MSHTDFIEWYLETGIDKHCYVIDGVSLIEIKYSVGIDILDLWFFSNSNNWLA